ncbi:TPA: hypothetical protein ACGOXG_000156 [Streptococcus suis]
MTVVTKLSVVDRSSSLSLTVTPSVKLTVVGRPVGCFRIVLDDGTVITGAWLV